MTTTRGVCEITKTGCEMTKTGCEMRKAWRGVAAAAWLTAAAIAADGVAAVAQEVGSAGEDPRVACFRGRPLPACKSFWIIEMQGHAPLIQTSRTVTYTPGYPLRQTAFGSELEWNLGHMVNLGPSWALGGVVTAGTGAGEAFTGLKLRARRWMSPNISVEAEGGLLRTDGNGALYPNENGVTADVRLNIRDYGSFYVRWDGVSVPARRYGPDGSDDPGGFHQALSVGVGLGSLPALVGTGALGLGYIILLGIFLGTDY